MIESKLSKEVIDKLNRMPFIKLKELIENCLRSKNERISQENSELFTTNSDLLKEYANFLEIKIISIPAHLPSFNSWKFIESESFIIKLEKLKKDLSRTYFLLKTEEQKGRKGRRELVNKYQKRFDKLKKEIRDGEKSERYLEALERLKNQYTG